MPTTNNTAPDVIDSASSRLTEPNVQTQRSIGGDRAAEAVSRYWKTNVRIMAALLLIWAAAGLGAGILFADSLSAYRIGGFPLGFWFAQQGSILVFVALILVYAIVMNRLDRKHHEDLEAARLAATNAELAAGSPSVDAAERTGDGFGARPGASP